MKYTKHLYYKIESKLECFTDGNKKIESTKTTNIYILFWSEILNFIGKFDKTLYLRSLI